MSTVDIDLMQNTVYNECMRRWPDTTSMREFIALVEEVGEVGRCLVKREEGTRGTPEEWTEQLRIEIGQALGVLISFAKMEGYSASECFWTAMEKFYDKPEREGMNLPHKRISWAGETGTFVPDPK